ncbi:hypothetical protein QVD17_41946 [Tagetes erecta]|uniref:MULE transposase domain-containing protein n=1 Tax=Tagetes erecta TaxID=13708 RepID=A0AAD8JLC6_TARER|nr:hypothetical protein QVD17_41946 [Tagetes erecta]
MIFPVAYALVDEETNDSWKWFLQQFQENVQDPRQRKLYVISDRHAGILHAMNNLEAWKEPHAHHRFCLRHVRSNFASKFKNVTLKRMCWLIGSTTQEPKYERLMRELETTNKAASWYLKQIDKTKWTLLYDRGMRRWGNLMSQQRSPAKLLTSCFPCAAPAVDTNGSTLFLIFPPKHPFTTFFFLNIPF